MVTRVVSQNVVKLDVIDLVGSLGHESLLNDVELLLANLHAEVVKDGAETSECDETAAVLILVLEVWFDQQTAQLDISAEALEHGDKNALLLIVKHILRVQDGRRVETAWQSRRVLLQRLVCEDVVELITEVDVVNEASIVGHGIMFLQALELSRRE